MPPCTVAVVVMSLPVEIVPKLPPMEHVDSEISLFRLIYVQDYVEPVKSLEEAEMLLQQDPDDARAHQYLGWHLLRGVQGTPDPTQAIKSLMISVKKGAFTESQSCSCLYLLI